MNEAQIRKYRYLVAKWREARQDRGLPCDDAARYALHERKIGRACSSTAFTQKEFDDVIAALMAEIKPADLTEQMRQQEQEELRIGNLLEDCRRAVGDMWQLGDNGLAHHGEAYIAGTCRNIAHKEPDKCSEEELRKVRGALQARVKRMRAKDPEKAARMDAARKQQFNAGPY